MATGGPRLAILGVVLALLPGADAVAQPGSEASVRADAITIGHRGELWSDALQEPRPYWVSLPASYDDRRYLPAHYPVLYLLDGATHFHAATGVVRFLSGDATPNFEIPELIVVGVPNVDRTRDLTPTHVGSRGDGSRDATLARSGGGHAFLHFLAQELVPHVEQTYRAAPYRLVAGHSLGGLFALVALVEAPELFQAVLAIDPSVFWDDALVVRRVRASEALRSGRRRAVYLSLSAHSPGGRLAPAVEELASVLAARACGGLRSTLRRFGNESHASVPLVSLHDGLRFIFAGYHLTSRQLYDQPADVGRHFAAVSDRLGFSLRPPEHVLDSVGRAYLDAGLDDRAAALFEVNVEAHPSSPRAHASRGRARALRGEIDAAIASYERALALGPHDRESADALRRLRAWRRTVAVR